MTPPGKFKGGPAADKGRAVIKLALENHAGPMSPMQLGDALTSAGLVFLNPAETAGRFMRGWAEVEKIDHGLYALASGAEAVNETRSNSTQKPETAPVGTLADFVLDQLRNHSRPVRLKELVISARLHGFDSAYLSSSIAGVVSKNSWAVLVGKGLYMLASEEAWQTRAEIETRTTKPDKGTRLKQVRNILRDAFSKTSSPMRLAEMTTFVRESGFVSRNPMAIVSEVIKKFPEFERVGYGVYCHKGLSDQPEQHSSKPYEEPYSEITGFILTQMETLKRPVGRAELRHIAIMHGHQAGAKLDHSIASALKGSRFTKVEFLGYVPAQKE